MFESQRPQTLVYLTNRWKHLILLPWFLSVRRQKLNLKYAVPDRLLRIFGQQGCWLCEVNLAPCSGDEASEAVGGTRPSMQHSSDLLAPEDAGLLVELVDGKCRTV